MLAKIVGVYLAVGAFLLATLLGVLRGVRFSVCLTRGLAALVLFWILGQVLAMVFLTIVRDRQAGGGEEVESRKK